MRRSALASACLLLAASCSGGPLDPLRSFLGDWEGTHRLAGDETAYAAAYTVSEQDGSLVWECRSEWNGGFTGRGVQTWDEAAGEFVEAWTDSTDPAGEWLMRGSWDEAGGALTMRGEGQDWETGAMIQFVHRTTREGRDAWRYVMTAERADGPMEVMWIEMRRR